MIHPNKKFDSNSAVYLSIYFNKASFLEIPKNILIMIVYYHVGQKYQSGKICNFDTVAQWWKIYLVIPGWFNEWVIWWLAQWDQESFRCPLVFFFFTRFFTSYEFDCSGKSLWKGAICWVALVRNVRRESVREKNGYH